MVNQCLLDSVEDGEDIAAQVGREANKFRSKLGDVSACQSVNENRVVSVVHILVHVGIIACIVILLSKQGAQAWDTLQTLGLASTLLAAFHLRHAFALAGKLAWYGFGTRTKLLVALGLAGFAAPRLLRAYRRTVSTAVVNALLTSVGLTSTLTIAVLVMTIRNPESAYFTAVMSAANRLASPSAIARLKTEYSIATT